MTSHAFSHNQKGFSLIEILMVLLLIGILTYVSLEAINNSVSDARFQETVDEMRVIGEAIVGNKKLQEGGTRTSFGYWGDVGALPTVIGDLTVRPAAVSAYTVSTASRTGYGWNGPYLESGDAAVDYTTDAWGNAYIWSPAAVPPTLVSRGSDGAAGGTGLAQDITISFPTNERVATVEGFVSNAGGPIAAIADVELNYPNGTGGLTQTIYPATVAGKGYFTFASVPYGVRSITIYTPTKAGSTNTKGPFVITIDKPKVFVPANQLDFNP